MHEMIRSWQNLAFQLMRLKPIPTCTWKCQVPVGTLGSSASMARENIGRKHARFHFWDEARKASGSYLGFAALQTNGSSIALAEIEQLCHDHLTAKLRWSPAALLGSAKLRCWHLLEKAPKWLSPTLRLPKENPPPNSSLKTAARQFSSKQTSRIARKSKP